MWVWSPSWNVLSLYCLCLTCYMRDKGHFIKILVHLCTYAKLDHILFLHSLKQMSLFKVYFIFLVLNFNIIFKLNFIMLVLYESEYLPYSIIMFYQLWIMMVYIMVQLKCLIVNRMFTHINFLCNGMCVFNNIMNSTVCLHK